LNYPKYKHDIKNHDFWDVMPYSLVEILQRFTGTNCFHFRSNEFIISWVGDSCLGVSTFYQTHDLSIQKTVFFIATAVRNLRCHKMTLIRQTVWSRGSHLIPVS